jgi:CMP-N-acetylneuraminic acid synthetase
MYKGYRFLTVIPARGGSKGLPRKNIRLLNGKPLLTYSVKQSLRVPYIDCIVVSSEDSEILSIAKRSGAIPLRRPARLASDKARTEGALLHAVDELARRGERFDFVITLEPTHPFRQVNTLKTAIERLVQGKYDSLLTLTPDHADLWREKKGRFGRLFPNAPRRRQDREPLYKENSLIYITAVAALRRRNFVIGKKPLVLLTPEQESLDIHSADDLALAHFWVRQKKSLVL